MFYLQKWLTKVGWAGENVAKMLAVHEVSAGLLDVGLELVESVDPSSPAGLHIAVLLHGDHSEVVFLVDPDLNKSVHLSKFQEVLTKKFFWSLCQIPRASGQSRAIPADVRRGETGLSKRKWSAMSCSCASSVISYSGKYLP